MNEIKIPSRIALPYSGNRSICIIGNEIFHYTKIGIIIILHKAIEESIY